MFGWIVDPTTWTACWGLILPEADALVFIAILADMLLPNRRKVRTASLGPCLVAWLRFRHKRLPILSRSPADLNAH